MNVCGGMQMRDYGWNRGRVVMGRLAQYDPLKWADETWGVIQSSFY